MYEVLYLTGVFGLRRVLFRHLMRFLNSPLKVVKFKWRYWRFYRFMPLTPPASPRILLLFCSSEGAINAAKSTFYCAFYRGRARLDFATGAIYREPVPEHASICMHQSNCLPKVIRASVWRTDRGAQKAPHWFDFPFRFRHLAADLECRWNRSPGRMVTTLRCVVIWS